jgi:TRAP-type C4-dicarboxylate transport system substrate-binding protein
LSKIYRGQLILKTQPTFNIMKNKQQRIEQLLHERAVRKQALILSVENEKEFLEKIGKKGLERIRNFSLDRMNEIDKEIEELSKL